MSYLTVSHCGTEHQEWLKAIDIYDNEIDILENRLTVIARKNTSREAMAGVEHFQNQFIVQRNNIDELRHNINEHAHKTMLEAQRHAGHIATALAEEHTKMKEEFTSFEKVVNEVRQEFNDYLTKWM
jgi:hypothetical protein